MGSTVKVGNAYLGFMCYIPDEEQLPDAVHIFSHKEWHMKAYAVRIDELTNVKYADEESYLFVHPKDTEAEYPIPSAFAAYAEYLNIKLGNDKF